MIDRLKQILYFPIAGYFRFFAAIRLKRWNPQVIVVTGSNGKTTLLHLLEAQIGEKAKYSHHANTSFGIPFDILDLHKKNSSYLGWLSLFLQAPFFAFKTAPKENIYVVEADAYSPGVGKFVGELLRPEIVLWVSTAITHSMNFDNVVAQGRFKTVEEAIAYEYGYFLEYCSKLAVIDGDSKLQVKQKPRAQGEVILVTEESYFESYEVKKDGTVFKIAGETFSFPWLLPQEIFYSLAMCKEAVQSLDLPFDLSFSNFSIPPGRGSIFQGIKDTTLIDSTYNGNLGSVTVMVKMFSKFPVEKKWVVLSDMLELGSEEKEEHEHLAEILEQLSFEKVLLLGPRTAKYTFAKFKKSDNVVSFLSLRELKEYMKKSLTGGEAILFKGSQSMYLDGIIEDLLNNKADAVRLPRRGEFWDKKRKEAGL